MNKQKNLSDSQLFKGRYIITFYDLDDNIVAVFNNIKEIAKYRGEEITQESYTQLKCYLYRALKRENHITRMLDGNLMQVYLIDALDDEEE